MSAYNMSMDDVLEKLIKIYEESYKKLFNAYLINVEFRTILLYYSGTCGIVVEFTSLPGLTVRTEMCTLVECGEKGLFEMDTPYMHKIIESDILKKFEGFLRINKELCGQSFTRPIIIKSSHFDDSTINIKIAKGQIILEINENTIKDMKPEDRDLFNTLNALSRYFQMSDCVEDSISND